MPFHFMSVNNSLLFCVILILILLNLNLINNVKVKNYLFIYLVTTYNITGLIPYCWCFTAFFWANFLISLMICLSIPIYNFINNMNYFMSHLLPSGSPLFLWDLLVILEMVSLLIRPLTLSLRLTCNLIAGHVIMGLSSKFFIFSVILFYFELMVSLIQSHVFHILSKIYKEEL